MKLNKTWFYTILLTLIGIVFLNTVKAQTVAITPTVNWSCGNEHITASTYTYVGGNYSTYRTNTPASPQSGQWVIPVVVHVMFDAAHATNDSFNISYQQIQWQISQLNRGFQNLILPGGMPRSTNVDIQFCLAQTAIGATWTNNAERGVMRYQVPSSTVSHTMNAVQQNLLLTTTGVPTAFPFQNYLNIFLVNEIVDTTGGIPTTGTIGYSSFPGNLSALNPIDGIVIRHDVFGSDVVPNHQNVLMGQLDQGNILTHEVGHYLGMFHTFEPGNCVGTNSVTCITQGDRICDTPPSQLGNTPCTNTSTCTDALVAYGLVDQQDMTDNFMCYADDNCMTGFSLDQAAVMQGVVNTAWPTGRLDMTTAANLTATGLTNAGVNCCPTGVTTAHFRFSPTATCNGMIFSAYVPACSMNQTYAWQFGDGGILTTAATNTTTHTYTTSGVYNVTLTVTGTNGSIDVCIRQIQVGTYARSSAKDICNNSVQGVNFHVATRITGIYTLDLNFNGVHTTHSYSINPGTQTAYNHPRMEDIEFNIPVNLPQASLPATHIYTITLTGDSICPITYIDTFRVLNCCNNIITNGDFNSGWTGWTHIPGPFIGTGPGIVWTYTPSAHIDSPVCGVPSTCTSLEIMNTTINTPLQASTNYHLNFQVFGGNPSTLKYNQFNFLMDTLFLNARLLDSIGSVIHDFGIFPVMDLVDSTWHHYDFRYTNTTALTHPHLSLSQVKNFYSLEELIHNNWTSWGWGYDYSVDEFSLRPEGLPPTVVVSPSTPTVCQSVTTTLTASGASTYSWTTGALTNTTTVSPSSTTIYTVIGTSALGCTATAQSTVNVNTAFIAVTPSVPVICVGQTTTLTASGAYTYSWSPGSITTASIAVSPTATTVYTVQGTNIITGCNNIKTVTVTVNPLPTLSISASNGTICAGLSTTLTASGASTYTWNTGITTSTIALSPTVTTGYTVTGTSSLSCTNTKSISITVNAGPSLTVVASPNAICVGQPSTLTASGANTYLWMPGSITYSQTAVYPPSNTTYSCTGTNTLGCTTTKTVTVTVNPLPTVTAVANPTLICSSLSSTLTAVGASTYTWSTGTVSVSTSVSPTVTTTYTVTGKSSLGCLNTKTVTVNVVPYTPVLTASSTAVAVCGSGSATLTVIGASTYTWNPGSLTGSTVAVTPTVATVYTVSGNYSISGCGTGTTSVVVNPVISTLCCTAATSTLGTSLTNTVDVVTGTYTTSSAIIYVQGVLSFTANTSYTGYTFRMAPGAALRVYPDKILTLTNCKFYSCTELWDGIYMMNDRNYLCGNVIANNSIFEDMYNGIVMDYNNITLNPSIPSGTLNLTGSTLNKNYTSVQFKNSPGFSSGTSPYLLSVVSSTISSNASSTSPGSTLKPSSTYTYAYNTITNGATGSSAPYLNFPRAFMGIYAVNLGYRTSLSVGSIASTSLTNTFDNMDFGINCTEVNTKVQNNYFKNITGSVKSVGTGPNPPPPAQGPDEIGIAVAVTQTAVANYNTATVGANGVLPTGGNPFPRGNKFEDCNKGVRIYNTRYATVKGNVFTTTNTSTVVVTTSGGLPVMNPNTYYYYTGQTGIWNAANGDNSQLSYNDIKNQSTGIYSSITVTLSGGTNPTNISNNDIGAPSSTGYCLQAIQVEQSGGSNLSTDYLAVTNNTITSVYRGIIGNNVLSGLLIFSNKNLTIEGTAKTLAYAASKERTGIALTGCQYASVKGNSVLSNAASIPTGTATAKVNGIYITNSINGKIECNTTTHLGRDFVFRGTSDNRWLDNNMSDSYTGLEFYLSGRFGTQGALSGSPSSPNLAANTWTTITQETNVSVSANVNANCIQYLLTNGAGLKTTPTLNFGTPTTHSYVTGAFDGIRTQTSGTSYTCNASGSANRMSNGNNANSGNGSNQKNVGTTDSLTDYINLANTDENTADIFTDEFIFINKQLVYNLIEKDSINPIAGGTLDNFYEANQNTAIDKLTEVQNAIANNDIDNAISSNASVPVLNQVEHKHQKANELVLKYLTDRFYVYTQDEKQELYNMANECIVKGYYVVQARNMLNLITNQIVQYNDECLAEANASRKAKPQTNQIAPSTSFNLFPNPNNGMMQLDYNLGSHTKAEFKLYDVTGKLISVKNIPQNEGSLKINEQNLYNGVYFYHILVGEKTIKTDKIVIIK